MRVNTILPAALVATASAKTVRVDVGKGGLTFSPEVIKADKGDMLEFHFYPQKHSVVLGDKDKACMPASSNVFYSGFVPSSNGEAKSTFQVKVDSTDAMYIYCSSGQHCQEGMAAVINGDQDGLDKYKDSAAKASENVSPKEVTGGMIMSAGSSMSMTSSGTDMSQTSGSSTPTASSSSMSMSSGSSMSKTTGGSGTQTTGSAVSSGTNGGQSSSSGAAQPSSTAKPGAAAGFKASVAGVLAAAGGVAAMML